MVGLPFTDLDYCCYCDWGYKKRTRLWNNIEFEGDRCPGKDACPNMEGNKHKSTAQQGKNTCKDGLYGNTFAEQGWEVVSLDSDEKTDATIHEDILTWDYTVYPPGHFDMNWASPCCTHYSCARRNAKTPRNLSLAESLVLRSREIIY